MWIPKAVQVLFDPEKLAYTDLLRWFWESHDPTQGMGQGNDRGTQYRSGLYWFDDSQKALILASKVRDVLPELVRACSLYVARWHKAHRALYVTGQVERWVVGSARS
jgi:hypothetical protein